MSERRETGTDLLLLTSAVRKKLTQGSRKLLYPSLGKFFINETSFSTTGTTKVMK